MTRYSFQSRDRIFIKDYGFLSFTRNMNRNIDKNISKKLSDKHKQKPFDHAKQFATDALKSASTKSAEATGDLAGNKIADKRII